MPVFVNTRNDLLVLNSYKVGYSKLVTSPNLRRLTNRAALLLLARRPRLWRNCVLLVRDPYKRIESLYTDKFIKFPADRLTDHPKQQEWSRYHGIVAATCGINLEVGFAHAGREFCQIGFKRFVLEVLPSTYLLDPHSWPQARSLSLPLLRRWDIRLRLLPATYRLESSSERSEFGRRTGVDMETRQHSSAAYRSPLVWTAPMREVVNSLYAEDFRRFTYRLVHGQEA